MHLNKCFFKAASTMAFIVVPDSAASTLRRTWVASSTEIDNRFTESRTYGISINADAVLAYFAVLL